MDHQELQNSEDFYENLDNLSERKKIIFINEEFFQKIKSVSGHSFSNYIHPADGTSF